MPNIKTPTLTAATEAAIAITGANCIIKNRTGAALYASATEGITADADGVKFIADGTSDMLRDISGTVYLLSASGGKVELEGTDYTDVNFKSAVGGGSALTADGTTISDNSGVLSANYSSANLLDNPDFAINQRGLTAYPIVGAYIYTVDRWRLTATSSALDVADGYVTLSKTAEATSTPTLAQYIEDYAAYAGEDVTLSMRVKVAEGVTINVGIIDGVTTGYTPYTGTGEWETISVTKSIGNVPTELRAFVQLKSTTTLGDAVNIKWAKLEIGNGATPFVAPNPATELIKCQRYYQLRSTNDIAAVDLRPTMRTTPTDIVAVTGGYAYIAEL